MNKKLAILLIFFTLVSSQIALSKDNVDLNEHKTNKFIEFFKFKKNKKDSENKQHKETILIIDKAFEGDPAKEEKITPGKYLQTPAQADSENQGVVLEDSTKPDMVMEGSVATNKLMSVDDCLKLALKNHPIIKYAMSDADIYKSRIAQAWSAYFPTFNLDANYSRNDMLMANFDFPKQKYGLYNVPRLGAEMLLFDFGKTKAVADISKKTYEASKENIQTSINQVIFNVKQAYFSLLFAMQQEQVYQETVADFELHLKQAEQFYDIGTKAKIDVMTAQYNLGKAKLNLIKATNTVDMAYAQLNDAMGLPEYTSYSVEDNLASNAYDIQFEDMIQTSYETRPELLAARKKAEASELLIRSSLRAFAPDIKAFGNYTLGGVTPAHDYGYQIGAGLSYNTTNLFLLKKQVDEAKATYKRDAADYEKQRQAVYLDVKQAYIDLHNAQESIPVAKLSVAQAEEQYKLASGRYEAGLGDAVELKDAETTFRNAQLDYYNTLMNYNVSAANLERVVGIPIKPSEESLL